MKLGRAIVASDLNPHYLSFWPVVHEAWNKVVGIPVTLVLISDELPPDIQHPEDVVLFPPIPEIPTASIAQCIRLLYPAMMDDCDDAVIVSDMDMIPTSRRYFCNPVRKVDNDAYVTYRGIHHKQAQIYMCYSCAKPSVWREIVGMEMSRDAALDTLRRWNATFRPDGKHGGRGWSADQRMLYKMVTENLAKTRVVALTDHHTGFRRLDRNGGPWRSMTPELEGDLRSDRYTDFHMPSIRDHEDAIRAVLDVLVDAYTRLLETDVAAANASTST